MNSRSGCGLVERHFHARKTEVAKFHGVHIVSSKHVAGLDVAMNNRFVVQVPQPTAREVCKLLVNSVQILVQILCEIKICFEIEEHF